MDCQKSYRLFWAGLPGGGAVVPAGSGAAKVVSESMNPAISVIIPVYNTGHLLTRCVESIFSQTFQDFEVILVDDGSTDNSGSLCDRYKQEHENVTVIHKENAGLGYARNTGIDAASGKYLSFVDSDDFVGCGFLQSLYTSAERNGADCAVAGFTVVYPGKQVSTSCTDTEQLFTGEEIKKLLLGSFGALPTSKKDAPYGLSVWSRLYRRELLDREHIRFVSEREYISEDIVFNIDFLRFAKRAVLVPDQSYHYICLNPNSLSSVYRSDRIEMDIILAKHMEKILGEIFPQEEYSLYWQRFLIMRIGYDLILEVRHQARPSLAYAPIKQALSDKSVSRALERYPWWRLPFLRMVLVGAMRFQSPRLLVWLIRMQQSLFVLETGLRQHRPEKK